MSHDALSNDHIAGWKRRFSQASSEQALVELARQFLASLPAETREVLRASSKTAAFDSPDAVLEFALHLTQLEMSLAWDDAAVARTVRTVGGVFIEAGKRLTALSEARVLRRFEDLRPEGPVAE